MPTIRSREGMPEGSERIKKTRSGALSFFWQHSQMLATEAAVRRKMFAAKMTTKKIATIHWYPVCVPACHGKCATWLTACLSDIFTGSFTKTSMKGGGQKQQCGAHLF